MIKPVAASRQGLGVRALAGSHSLSNTRVPPSHSRMHQRITGLYCLYSALLDADQHEYLCVQHILQLDVKLVEKSC